ncbi:MAG: type II toxin-antitoxin system HicB family antitoxin [Planctomycetota bacterium]
MAASTGSGPGAATAAGSRGRATTGRFLPASTDAARPRSSSPDRRGRRLPWSAHGRSSGFPSPRGAFFVDGPMLPGCYSQGETVEEALSNIAEAIALALEDMAEHGEPIPDAGEPIIAQVRVAG